MFLISLTNFLVQANAGALVKEKLPQILDIVISYLKYIQFMEQNGGKIVRKLDIGSDDEDNVDGARLKSNEVLREFLGNNAGLDPAVFGAFSNEDESDDEEDEDDDEEGDDEDEPEVLYASEKVMIL